MTAVSYQRLTMLVPNTVSKPLSCSESCWKGQFNEVLSPGSDASYTFRG